MIKPTTLFKQAYITRSLTVAKEHVLLLNVV